MNVILIAAVTVDGYIARHSHEVIDWSEDLALFKKQTMGHPVIMGANTRDTLPSALINREMIVVHRNDDPKQILSEITAETCFVIGGGKTNAMFAPYLTHLYLTVHPLVFGSGIKSFDGLKKEIELKLIKTISVDPERGIFQFQYAVKMK